MSTVSPGFLQTRKGRMFWRYIFEMLTKKAEWGGVGWGGGGQRAPVFTSPEPIAAFYYQNNSIPSAGRLPLPGQLYSDAGENLHSAEGWMMPDLAVVNTASSGRMSCPPELAYFLPWVYLCQQISCRSWGIDADCLQQWDWCAGRGRGKRKIRWLHGRS